MEKHKFNIFPEMSAEEYEKLKSDLLDNDYDTSQPIVVFQGAILDGWNRFKACEELGIGYAERMFLGTQVEAMQFVTRTNSRRNLSSQQWAAIAVEADEIIEFLREAVENERRQKQSENAVNRFTKKENLACDNGLSQPTPEESGEEFPELVYEIEEKQDNRQPNTVAHKLAEQFNTNRTYVREAQKLKETAPEKLQEVKEGKTTFQQIKKEAPIPEIDVARFDDFTNLAKHFGNGFISRLKDLKEFTEKAQNSFKVRGKDLDNFASDLTVMVEDLTNYLADAVQLRHLEKCGYCLAKGCDVCTQGYVINKGDEK